jgi:cytochrome c553
VLLVLLVVAAVASVSVTAQDDGPPPLPDPNSDDPVERGEYLFRMQFICIGCHLGPNADGSMPESPLVAQPTGGEIFELPIGVVYSRNLTQVSDWSAEELETAIRYGVSADGEVLLPIMAFSLYEGIDDEDMADLIAYLQSLEPIENEITPPEFLIPGMSSEDFRFQGEIDIDKERPPVDADDQVAQGSYLANMAACMHCHGQVGEDLIAVPAPEGLPWGWIAPPLLSYHLDEIYSSPEEIRAAITTGVRPNGDALDIAMPWQIFSLWQDEDIDALVAWIESLPDDLSPADHPFPVGEPAVVHD